VYRQLYAVVVRSLFIVRVSYVYCVLSEAEERALDFLAMLTRLADMVDGADAKICEWMDKAEAHELAENRIVRARSNRRRSS